MTGIEHRLRDALTARAAGVVDDGVPRALPAPRRRPSWRAPVAVTAAIVVVVAATVVGTRLVPRAEPAVGPTPSATAMPTDRYIGPLAPPIDQVWPGAVHEIPATGPGGRVFTPEAFATGRVVVGRGLTRNRLDGIWSYDLVRRSFTRITPLKDTAVAGSVAVGGGYVAWHAYRDRKTEIWAVPLKGGTPHLVTTTPAVLRDDLYEGVDLAIVDDMAVWTPADGGVHRAPLTGGDAELMPGTKGYHLLAWPYAARPETRHQSVRPNERLIDVRTGERLPDVVLPPGRTSWNGCGVTWCSDGTAAWRRDGTRLRRLPGLDSGLPVLLSGGRFLLLRQSDREGRQASAVHDLATGRTGVLGPVRTAAGRKPAPTLHVEERMIWYKRGDEQVVVNLNGIR
ncbi:hypothetical protein ACIBP6_31590 [Nonomuraea terrae]|uniref:hypothetical protein n=1 Tax=Nonomuraea terrae TaxID=2530383 RepID=UPI0037B9CD83